MRRKVNIYIFILAAIIITISGCSKKEEKKVISEAVAEKKQTVDATGVIKSGNVRNIVLDFSCNIDKIDVKEGQTVKSGDVLVDLNISDYKQKIDSKQKELDNSTLELAKLLNKIQSLSSDNPDIKKLQNDINFSEDLYKKKQEELASKEKLFSSGAISKAELEDFKKDVDQVKKDLDDAVFALDKMNHDNALEINTDQNQEVKILNNKIEGLKSELEAMKEKLNKAYIKDSSVICDVPNAIISEIGYTAGDIVSPDKKLLNILNLEDLHINGEVPEEFIKDVKLGAEVTISPIKDKSKEYKGKISRISNVAVLKNGETIIPVEVTMDGSKDSVIVNSNVDLKINIQ